MTTIDKPLTSAPGAKNCNAAKLIAIYFPQLHPIPENDEWWGEGFTDWNNVKTAEPLFEGHYQPRVPLNKNYYNQSELDTVRSQVELAKRYGVYGFCHYHYWFDGKQLLETPTNLMLENKDINFPFCLSWANETWSRRWDGRDHHILIQQTHPPEKERWALHFDYLIKAWEDERAIKVDGKPVFVIYRPQNIPEVGQMLDFWKEKAVKRGLKGLYFMIQKQSEFHPRDHLKHFDGVFQFQPTESVHSPEFDNPHLKNSIWRRKLGRHLPFTVKEYIHRIENRLSHNKKSHTFHDYNDTWDNIAKIRSEPEISTYPGAFIDWDNTPRYKERAIIFKNASPENFEKGFSQLVKSLPERKLPENFIFLNAWNEWAEGAYLEPDERYRYAYLEAIKAVLDAANETTDTNDLANNFPSRSGIENA